MESLTSQLTWLLATSTLLADAAAVGFVAYFSFLFFKDRKRFTKNPLVKFFHQNSYLFAFLISLTATGGSLFYSEVAKYPPCKLCWYQRIFMYPLVPLFGLALWQREKKITDYLLSLSLMGILVSIYHYGLQQSITSLTPCAASGEAVSCADYYTISYGYITIPMMTVTAFGLILLLMILEKIVNWVSKSASKN